MLDGILVVRAYQRDAVLANHGVLRGPRSIAEILLADHRFAFTARGANLDAAKPGRGMFKPLIFSTIDPDLLIQEHVGRNHAEALAVWLRRQLVGSRRPREES